MLFSILEINLLFAFFISFLYLGVIAYKFRYDYAYIEEKSPLLRDELRTFVDTAKEDGELLNNLRTEVLKRVHTIKLSSLINTNLLTKRILILGMFGFFIILISVGDLHFNFIEMVGNTINEDIEIKMENEKGIRDGGKDVTYVNDNIEYGDLSEVFGDGNLANLDGDELSLELNLLDSEIVLGDYNDIKEREFFPPNFPKEIYTSYDVSYTERIADEHKRLIKTYFDEIAVKGG